MESSETQVLLQRTPPKPPVSFEAFLEWCDEDILAEWVEGGVLVMSPASDLHQNISDFLTVLLRIYIEAKELGWVRSAPFVMRLEQERSGREPDLLFVVSEHLDRVQKTYLDGPADMVVEIVSEESIGRDRGEKFVEYERAGIPEYWLIDPERKQAEFYRLGEDRRYRPAALKEGIFHSDVLKGFRLKVDWLWQDPLPKVMDVVNEVLKS